jgi:hypothetical protein
MILKTLVAAAIAAILCDVADLTPGLFSGANLISDHPRNIARHADEHTATAAELRCLSSGAHYSDTNKVRFIGVNCFVASHPSRAN